MNDNHPLPWKHVPYDTNVVVQDANGVTIFYTDQATADQILEGVNSTLDKRIQTLVAEVKRLREEKEKLAAEAAREKATAKTQHDHLREVYGAYKQGVLDSSPKTYN